MLSLYPYILSDTILLFISFSIGTVSNMKDLRKEKGNIKRKILGVVCKPGPKPKSAPALRRNTFIRI